MSNWQLYRGDGKIHDDPFPPPPPWRKFKGDVEVEREWRKGAAAPKFKPTASLIDAVNAALYLRRPLLVTGQPGSGKSSLIEAVAYELQLGAVLRWNVTSHSTLKDALYRYDALGRLQDHQLGTTDELDIGKYLDLGPLGTALLPTSRPRALLIDEIDKSDIDLPNDLLHVFERGEFEIPELARLEQETVNVRAHGEGNYFPLTNGKLLCCEFPFVVLTSNGERDFPAAFLRRCVRFTMPAPDEALLTSIVESHLGKDMASAAEELIEDFAKRAKQSSSLATDQLLNAVFMVTNRENIGDDDKATLKKLLLRELRSDRA